MPPILGVLSPALAQSKHNAKVNFKKSTQGGSVTDKIKKYGLKRTGKTALQRKRSNEKLS
jgi:hypothetical protein